MTLIHSATRSLLATVLLGAVLGGCLFDDDAPRERVSVTCSVGAALAEEALALSPSQPQVRLSCPLGESCPAGFGQPLLVGTEFPVDAYVALPAGGDHDGDFAIETSNPAVLELTLEAPRRDDCAEAYVVRGTGVAVAPGETELVLRMGDQRLPVQTVRVAQAASLELVAAPIDQLVLDFVREAASGELPQLALPDAPSPLSLDRGHVVMVRLVDITGARLFGFPDRITWRLFAVGPVDLVHLPGLSSTSDASQSDYPLVLIEPVDHGETTLSVTVETAAQPPLEATLPIEATAP